MSEFSSPPNATGVAVPSKTTGAAIRTGTNDADFVTPKALRDSAVGGILEVATSQSSVLVAGAGGSEANGTYTYTGQHNGYAFYNKTGTNPVVSSIFFDTGGDGNWALTVANGDIWYTSEMTTDAYPWLSGLDVVNSPTADAPAPTVTEVKTGRFALPTTTPLNFQAKDTDTGFTYTLIDPALVATTGWYRNPVIQTAVLTADFDKTNDTLTAVSDLTLNLLAGHWYRVTGLLHIVSDSNGCDLSFAGGDVVIPNVTGHLVWKSLTTSLVSDILLSGIDTLTNISNSVCVQIEFVAEVLTGGTLIPQFAGHQHVGDCSIIKYASIQCIDVTPG
jgi:hypothetical protein